MLPSPFRSRQLAQTTDPDQTTAKFVDQQKHAGGPRDELQLRAVHSHAETRKAGATFMQLSRDGVTLSAEDMRAGFARLGVAVDGAELEFISR